MEVYNKWGEKVFESKEANQAWDGTYKGRMQNPGVYIYRVRLIFYDDSIVTDAGSLSLLR